MLSYTTPKATVQQVLQQHHHRPTHGNQHIQKVLHRLRVCRTAALGYHAYQCSDEACSHIKYQYHSCRDRHCPNCGAIKKQEWIEARMQELLPVKYYHIVFTLPHELNSLVLGHRQLLFKLLFDASSQTLLTFAKDARYLDALPGIISVLHTWGQQLSFHPHIHCIVSGGGITNENKWKDAKKSKYDFLFPVDAMHTVYRGKFLQGLQQLIVSGEVVMADGGNGKALINLLYQKEWVVYAKAPFGGPHAVIEYLGRYTHKVAISNHRINRSTKRMERSVLITRTMQTAISKSRCLYRAVSLSGALSNTYCRKGLPKYARMATWLTATGTSGSMKCSKVCSYPCIKGW